MATERQYTNARQRLARAIEDAYPREITKLVDFIACGHGDSSKYNLQRKLLEWSNLHYNESNGQK